MANVYTSGMCCHFMDDVEVYGEINGVNQIFYLLHNYTSGTLRIYLNGIRLTPGLDYEEFGTASFRMFVAPLPHWPYFYPFSESETNDYLVASYTYEVTMRCGSEYWEINEIPEGVINNINTDFTTKFSFATIKVFLNGDRLSLGKDFVITGNNSFRLFVAPLDDFNGKDRLLVDYMRSAA